MGGLIDRQKLLADARKLYSVITGRDKPFPVAEAFMDVIEKQPVVGPRPKSRKVVKSNGRMGYWACEHCGEPLDKLDNFCPNCGADIREVAE